MEDRNLDNTENFSASEEPSEESVLPQSETLEEEGVTEEVSDPPETKESVSEVKTEGTEKKRKSKRHQRIISYSKENDIRYRGPLSYRGFRILAWLCVVASQAAFLMSLGARMDPGIERALGNVPIILRAVSNMALPFFLFANFAKILNVHNGYKKMITQYALCTCGVIVLFFLFYRRYLIGIAALVTGSVEVAETGLEFAELLLNGKGFIAFNLFVDLLLCTLFMYFLNYKPEKQFQGGSLIWFRMGALLPVIYEILSIVLKTLATTGNYFMPVWMYPFLTTKPPMMFVTFIILALFVKNRENIFRRNGRTHEEFKEYLTTNRNSFDFAKYAALVVVMMSVLDFIIYFAGMVILGGMDGEGMVKAAELLLNLGFGQSTIMLLVAPFLLLFSYTRKHNTPWVDLAIPVVGVALILLVYLEGFYQFLITLSRLIKPFLQEISSTLQ